MSKGRMEAFSDGVIAIIITIMVLELKAPEGTDLAALRPLFPVFLSYVLIPGHLYGRDPVGLCATIGGIGAVCCRRHHMVDPGSAY